MFAILSIKKFKSKRDLFITKVEKKSFMRIFELNEGLVFAEKKSNNERQTRFEAVTPINDFRAYFFPL